MNVVELIHICNLDFKNHLYIRYNRHLYSVDNAKTDILDRDIRKVEYKVDELSKRVIIIVSV